MSIDAIVNWIAEDQAEEHDTEDYTEDDSDDAIGNFLWSFRMCFVFGRRFNEYNIQTISDENPHEELFTERKTRDFSANRTEYIPQTVQSKYTILCRQILPRSKSHLRSHWILTRYWDEKWQRSYIVSLRSLWNLSGFILLWFFKKLLEVDLFPTVYSKFSNS